MAPLARDILNAVSQSLGDQIESSSDPRRKQ